MADIDWIDTPEGRQRRPRPQTPPGPGTFYFPDRPTVPFSGLRYQQYERWHPNDMPTLRQIVYVSELPSRSDTWVWYTLSQRFHDLSPSKIGTVILEVIGQCCLVMGGGAVIGGGIGAGIGSLVGGIGAVPGALLGAETGAELGAWCLNFLGLASLGEFISQRLPAAIEKLQQGVSMAWEAGAYADGDNPYEEEKELNRAANVFADGRILLIDALLAGILAGIALKGSTVILKELGEGTRGLELVRWVAEHRDRLRGWYGDENATTPHRITDRSDDLSHEQPPAGTTAQGGSSAGRNDIASEVRAQRDSADRKPQRTDPEARRKTKAAATNVRLNRVRSSQGYVTSKTRDGTPITEISADMRDNGWNGGKPPPEMVEYPDGRIVTVDHRRLVAAQRAGIEEVPAIIHPADEAMTKQQAKRFRLETEISDPVTGTAYKRKALPRNWGEAAIFRCANQRIRGYPDFPLEGMPGLPPVKGEE
jgi:hypothetical protein